MNQQNKQNDRIQCIACGQMVREDVNYCPKCGSEQKSFAEQNRTICACGQESGDSSDKYCRNCGRKIRDI